MSRQPTPKPSAPSGGVLVTLAVLGLASLVWAGFQWQQLFVAREGGTPICGPGSGGCTELWDSPFASSVHAWTGLPIAGWGVLWGLLAVALPILSLARAGGDNFRAPLWASICLVAAGGAAGVLGLALVSASAGQLCMTCALTYALVLAYTAVCVSQVPRIMPSGFGRASLIALAVTAVGFVLLLPRGQRTPVPQASALARLVSTPETDPDQALRRLVASLTVPERSLLRQALESYKAAPVVTARPPRFVIGSQKHDVRVTEFTDVLCSHCADLHETVEEIRRATPWGLVGFEPRQFPLDARCNPGVDFVARDAVRCEAARVLICLEGQPGYFEYSGKLFREQASLEVDRLYALAASLRPEQELRACARSVETGVALEGDIAWATEHEIQGTPLTLIDGKRAPAYPPFLYAMILARGNPNHPAFSAL